MDRYQEFLALHKNDQAPLLIGNVWDVPSAKVFEAAGCKALGTSSSAVARSLGYKDGEAMTFEELVFVVERISRHISVPLSVDIEGGYSRIPDKVIEHIEILYKLGVAGINLEDSIVADGSRQLLKPQVFKSLLEAVSTSLKKKGLNIFLNIRTDPYLIGISNPLTETLDRIAEYQESGADGIFVPCIVNKEDIYSDARYLVTH